MAETTKQISKAILGNQSDNPYETMMANVPTEGEQSIDHQAAFEAQLKASKQAQNHMNPQYDEQNQYSGHKYAFEENGSYCKTGTFEEGFLESDLQIFKEKGIEQRFVSFKIWGFLSPEEIQTIQKQNGLAYLTMIMSSEEQFNRFKQFVASWNWND